MNAREQAMLNDVSRRLIAAWHGLPSQRRGEQTINNERVAHNDYGLEILKG